jgi:hypothetical protein
MGAILWLSKTAPAVRSTLKRRRRRGRSRTDTGRAGDIARGSTQLRLGGMAVDGSAIVLAAEDSAVHDEPVRDLYDRDLVLVRLDQHINWRGNRVPAGMRGPWRRVTRSGSATQRSLAAPRWAAECPADELGASARAHRDHLLRDDRRHIDLDQHGFVRERRHD